MKKIPHTVTLPDCTEPMSPSQVLIVDDDLTALLMLQRMVQDLGYECETALNGADAVEAACNKTFCAVFMDYLMPVMNGCDAAARIKGSSQNGIKGSVIIGMISLDDPATRKICQSSGMSKVLCKPINREELAKCLCFDDSETSCQDGQHETSLAESEAACHVELHEASIQNHTSIYEFQDVGSRNSPAALLAAGPPTSENQRSERTPPCAGLDKVPERSQNAQTTQVLDASTRQTATSRFRRFAREKSRDLDMKR